MSVKKLSREEIARIEIGHTAISRPLAVLLSFFFIGSVFLVPVAQYVLDRGNRTSLSFPQSGDKDINRDTSFVMTIKDENNVILNGLHQFEITLEANSFLKKNLLPPLQYVLLRFLGQGNNKAIAGQNGWLYYWPGVDYLIGQPFLHPEQLQARMKPRPIWEKSVQPDPVRAIVGFKKQLAERGIELLIVPVPTKSAIHPERLSSRSSDRPLENRSWPHFISLMEKNGVHVFDARPLLAEYDKKNDDAYLATDTHWVPGAMQAVAQGVAASVETWFPKGEGASHLQVRPVQVKGVGDIARMLTLPDRVHLFPQQEVEISQVLTDQREFWQPDRNAEILLLGDSFTNIYSVNGLGWGTGAGFAEHLSYHLQRPLDLFARNDSGAYITRELLADELRRGRDRLASKKLVIWQFAERELSQGDWKLIDMALGETPSNSGFYVSQPGKSVAVTGVIAAISRSPEPGAGPYRDNILTMHLVDLQVEGKSLEKSQALVYGWGMQDNKLTDMAAYRAGDTISVTLTSWEELESEYGSYRRSSLDDEMIELEIPNWGKLTNE